MDEESHGPVSPDYEAFAQGALAAAAEIERVSKLKPDTDE